MSRRASVGNTADATHAGPAYQEREAIATVNALLERLAARAKSKRCACYGKGKNIRGRRNVDPGETVKGK